MNSDLRDRVGAALGNAYTVERELGGGGMSHVFLARDTALGRDVVVKLVPWDFGGGGQAERFRREIAIVARLQHPHIVPVLSAGEIEGHPYYTMPFVDGESLGSRIRRSGELPVIDAVRMLRDIAVALEYAHQHGIVHRDIKPDNVLLTEGVAVVTDFGVAKAVSAAVLGSDGSGTGALTPLGSALGTPAYMAPEQALGDDLVDGRADIYSVGCLAYEMLSGASPFANRSAQATIAAHVTEAPVPLSRHRPAVAGPLDDLVMCCLEKRPADRPQTAHEIVQSLDKVAAALGSGAGHVASRAPGSPLWRSSHWKRLPMPAKLATVGIAAVAALVAANEVRARVARSADQQVLAVLPLRVMSADPALRAWRERLVYLIEDEVARGHTVRTVDAHALLGAWRRAGGNDTTDLPPEAELQLARRLGAGQLLIPSLISDRGEQTVRATMIDLVSKRSRRSAMAKGPSDSVQVLVNHVLAELLALRANEEAGVASALANVSLPALDAYLEGRVLYRAGRMLEARGAFTEALQQDSTFALAAFYLGQTAWWPVDDASTRTRGHRVAWAHRDQLPLPHRLRLMLEIGRSFPEPARGSDGGPAIDSLKRAAPNSAEAWHSIGDWMYHWGATVGMVDAGMRAQEALARSVALDSSYAPALEHLPQLYWEHGDTAALRRSLALVARLDTTAVGRERADLQAAALLADSAAGASVFRRVATSTENAASLNQLMTLSNTTGRYLDMAGVAARRVVDISVTPEERGNALFNAARHELIVGHPTAAAKLRQGNQNVRPRSRFIIVDLLLRDGDSTAAREAIRELAPIVEDSVSQGTVRRAWVQSALSLAQGRAALGDSAGALRLIGTLRQAITRPDQLWLPAERDASVLLIVAALTTAADPEAHRIAERLDSTLLVATYASDGTLPEAEFFLSSGILTSARLWERLGDVPRALAAIRRQPRVGSYGRAGAFMYDYARLAALAGERDEAIKTYRHYLATRSDPEPSLRPMVARVRSELAHLERNGEAKSDPGRLPWIVALSAAGLVIAAWLAYPFARLTRLRTPR